MPIIAYIGLGSNMGDKLANCHQALKHLGRLGTIRKVSSFYSTAPVGFEVQDDFINAVAALETDLTPQALLAECLAIEKELGRRRIITWGPRTIDIDILLYGDLVINEPGLALPHPLMQKRRFVLTPFAEIAPEVRHPVLHKTIAELLNELNDSHAVDRCGSESRSYE